MPAKPLSIAALLAFFLHAASPAVAQLAPPSTGGIVTLDRLLQRLGEPRRVLVIGAHPDDEDTGLLSLLARGFGADAAYLALSRGEGGQNLIGDELGLDLGLVRSRELEAARSVDGARQFFTRSYDFGYSRSFDETSGFWLPDSVLKDVVRVVRRFKPHVIVSVFSGTERDGHGQHQMAGVMAGEAYERAGDPTVFPELEREEGLEPWTPHKLYRSARFNRAQETLRLPTGLVDPRVGRTYNQIAMESRSQHRSQDMGRIQPTGPAWARLSLERDRTGDARGSEARAEVGIFDGIPLVDSWLKLLADSLRGAVTPSTMASVVEPLAGALSRATAEGLDDEAVAVVGEAVVVAAGLVMDARATASAVVPGQRFAVAVELYNGGPHVVSLRAVSLSLPRDWTLDSASVGSASIAPGESVTAEFAVGVAPDADFSQPYYLENRMIGSLYDWGNAAPEVRGLPFEAPPVMARIDATVLGAEVVLQREASFRYNDQAVGEVREALRVVPVIEVSLSPGQLIWPATDDAPREFEVRLIHNGSTGIRGEVGLEVDGWAPPAAQSFQFDGQGESRVFRFRLARPPNIDAADLTVRAVATSTDGRQFDRAAKLIQYGHIRPVSRIVEARAALNVVPLRLPQVARVAYVRGAADRVPEALEQVGLAPEMLDAEALAGADLSSFDAIVIGSRAYETDTALVNHNDRLLEYVETGGRLIVQYQQYQFANGEFAPYPLHISRPHDRITDENAPVRILVPGHAAFNEPNQIAASDWEGWPQERGLYFAGTWDPLYTPLVEMKDPNRDPIRGGLLVTRYGDGTYVYTGISFFRSLPAGVPGAYKLFLNLIGLDEGNTP